MAERAPLIPYLLNVKRWVWLSYLAGFVLFFGLIALIDVLSAPGTPARELIDWTNGWLFLLPAAAFGYGVYVSVRYWRCPQCRVSLPTKYPLPIACRRCGGALRDVRAGT